MSRELILYATPTGRLAELCDQYFRTVADSMPTVAQTYPPHCTLTGFFHRADDELDRLLVNLTRAEADCAARCQTPEAAVRIIGLHVNDGWVGFELSSPSMLQFAERFAALDEPGDGDDPIRLKSWLHLSLAYGVPDLSEHASLAHEVFDDDRSELDPPSRWDVALWQRSPSTSWTRHIPEVRRPSNAKGV